MLKLATMALVTNQLQGSCATLPCRPLSCSKGVKLKHYVANLRMVGRTDFLLKRDCCLSVGAPNVWGLKVKPFQISAFKGIIQNDDSGGRKSESRSTKNSVKLSFLPQDDEEPKVESPNAQSAPLQQTSEVHENLERSTAVQNLFKKWLMMLRTQSPAQVADGILEGPPPREVSDAQNGTHKKERGEILKAVWSYFLGMDATIKIPLLIFVPWYLAVKFAYGAEVSKELTPLWILGPLVVALYIKMLRGIIGLYVFSFKQTVKVITNLPTYCIVAYTYVAHGKLKDDLLARFWQPLVDIRNLDYKMVSKRKMKELQEWFMEMYLDYVESIWPYYCRTIRFLKRANLI